MTPPAVGRVVLLDPGTAGKGDALAAFLSSDFLTSEAAETAATLATDGATTPGAQFRVLYTRIDEYPRSIHVLQEKDTPLDNSARLFGIDLESSASNRPPFSEFGLVLFSGSGLAFSMRPNVSPNVFA